MNMVTDEIRKRFLTGTDETGRFVVKSLKTGIEYFVEPIGDGRVSGWGDYDMASKSFTGDYGHKYTGSVTENESIVTKENGFKNICRVDGDPLTEIERRDREYERKMK